MDPQLIQVTTTPKGITTITITRPRRRNAVNPATARALYAAFLAFEADSTQKVAILTGAGGTFCAGADLIDLTAAGAAAQQRGRPHPDPSGNNASTNPNPNADASHLEPVRGRNIGPMGPSRLQVIKPVIAAVAGHAVAGGLELSLLADMRVVEEDATFGVYCRRWGVPLIDGGTVRLQAIVGLGRALDMILTGRGVSAAEALGMGLANRVVGRGRAVEEATRIAEQLVEFPQGCMLADRASCYYAAFEATGFEDALRREYDEGVGVVEHEGMAGAARFAGGQGRGGVFGKSKL
ncbi:enoyl-CoA hydratase [Cladophialophora yegresii CBS 114405]|uniref:Enoyl-CoA hydratase n=1 Tax=Cladophialophora yegresii CBS 114405 TaxID=1182544 RepID=W9WB06_9EURO|nr:enoyl-CoA hydratase [Cladophialophora yegresii CBS 114405]EXJ55734.1 enoyl-CoA hydratase [Cladophialophora yegresii CBS 114405]